ncbi:hypothetical protein CTAYLR_006830 [Chrysophaeum taylorii]|uniref:Mitochondrial carrier protein n=1 Tax=Chrysophaeum taylorii TaxID=2483200 RepID=A0AAD7UBK2_9STRA|nr:hypothetical protein CTAYLR_006830 [Chrysophaeum taylorii]
MLGGAAEIVAASILAGWAQHASLHPLDTLKVRLQYSRGVPFTSSVRAALSDALQDLEMPTKREKSVVQNLARQTAKSSRGGIWAAPLMVDIAGVAKMLRSTNVASLYAGLVPSLLAVIPTAIVYMPTYELASAALSPVLASQAVAPLAGVVTGVVCATVRVPASVLKSRVQLGLAPSATSALRMAFAAGGLRNLYAGFAATLALDVATAVVQFSALDVGRRTPYISTSPATLGFLASALATTCTEPIDVVRTRIMARVKGRPDSRFHYAGLFDGLATAARTEGIAALYRGLLPRLVLKSFGGAIWYSTYVYSKSSLASLRMGGLSPDAPHKTA